MTIILTNDDGIDAPGIQALLQAVNGKAIVVAPQGQLSGCGHQVTAHSPIHVDRRSSVEYAVGGTPADCVRIALNHLCPKPELVLSGINAGGNLGVDVYLSGTVAAVREAAMHGIPGVAISHWIKRPWEIDWEVATRWTSRVLADLLNREPKSGCFWNVNFPHLAPGSAEPEIVFCRPSTEPLPLVYRQEGEYFNYVGEYGSRDRAPGTDVDVCFGGNIAVTQISL
jgi:5'-nucleotidase